MLLKAGKRVLSCWHRSHRNGASNSGSCGRSPAVENASAEPLSTETGASRRMPCLSQHSEGVVAVEDLACPGWAGAAGSLWRR